MTVLSEKDAIKLRDALTRLAGIKPAPKYETFFYSGDSSETDFPLPKGWKPKNVFVDGALYRPGSSEDYTVTNDGFVYTVVFAVAPAVVDVGIMCEQEIS